MQTCAVFISLTRPVMLSVGTGELSFRDLVSTVQHLCHKLISISLVSFIAFIGTDYSVPSVKLPGFALSAYQVFLQTVGAFYK